ncbi:Anti-sigma-D factor RsdA to sigma factor binding region [Lentzea albidocapillata subsp. violacea]|uniref:Anti-sigma-D factor RsdA to sigma factor binding region n=1 Tax=Lentzea albidocapillata subsp. violacea TaxID=128104 RepID=A0A1G8W1K1_9PSEU|nr:anti-sigma-D factor RsdA [Lentzea albidocapillata]SDJ72241.1 Anti-sigma-D factor RsdA to sigma factor binding region [Lentzea albidocapillata subsp. violacea]
MADEHGKDDEEVRGQDDRAPHEPVADDLSAVQADDRLLDALGSATPGVAGSLGDDDLNALLLAWRNEVETEPFGELVDTDTAIATIQAARPQPVSRHRFLIPLASAAAVLAIAFTGVSLVARDAQPGDALWGLTRVLYSEHAKSIEAAAIISGDLESARLALREGKVNEAREKLDKIGASLDSVSTADGKQQLEEKHKELEKELDTNTSTAPPTSTLPPVTQPSQSSQPSTTPSAPSTEPSTTQPSTPPSSETPAPPTSNGEENPPPPPPPDPGAENPGSTGTNGESTGQSVGTTGSN